MKRILKNIIFSSFSIGGMLTALLFHILTSKIYTYQEFIFNLVLVGFISYDFVKTRKNYKLILKYIKECKGEN